MRVSGLPAAILALVSVVQSVALEKRDLLQDLQDQALTALREAEANGTLAKRGGCSLSKATVRRDWQVLLCCCLGKPYSNI
jgi:tyrosinase